MNKRNSIVDSILGPGKNLADAIKNRKKPKPPEDEGGLGAAVRNRPNKPRPGLAAAKALPVEEPAHVVVAP